MMQNPVTRLRLTTAPLWLVLLLVLGWAGCEGQPDKPRPPAAPGADVAAAEPTAPLSPARTLPEVAAHVAAQVEQVVKAEPAALAKAILATGPDAKVVKSMYGEPKPRYFGIDGQPNADGAQVLKLLGELDRHGINKAGYRLDALDAALAGVRKAFEQERAAVLALQSRPRVAVVAQAAAVWLRGGEGGELVLVRAGGDQLVEAGLRKLDEGLPKVLEAATTARQAIWQADLEISRAAVRYLIDFELAKPAHPLNYTPPSEVRRMSETFADKLVARLGSSRGKVAEVMRSAWPTHPQYAALLDAGDLYAKYVAAGGWQPLPKLAAKKVAKGDTGPFVDALRERLAAEGYDPGDGQGFDEGLNDAVVKFQEGHQLDADGVVSKTTISELDVPAERRLELIRLSLERYRESEGRNPENFHIFVNIAFQKLWVYEGGKVVREHRVIVGNNENSEDQQTLMKGKINRTKMFSKPITRVILAPRWYPTQRVIELEIQKSLAKQPDYLEKHGYVSEMGADGVETYYQKAGPDNLLGDVKFQGPNKYNIYLHDTPFRALFGKARRAFSHGCIRVQNPIDLAEDLLQRDRGMTPGQIRAAIDEKEEKIVNLKTPIPVHIDYASAGVDEEGHVVFGNDVYGYDQAFFDGLLPVEEAKEYKAASVRGL
ncbi:MAG: L,D-transpeptidase family protein [Myxococcota bacterium]